jgi:hypothetical protein
MKKTGKLKVSRETIRILNATSLDGVYGGATTYPTESCSCSCDVPITPPTMRTVPITATIKVP